MKTNFKTLLLLTASCLLLSGFYSCKNDDNEVNNEPTELRISCGIEVLRTRAAANTQEKTIVNGETVSLWVDDATTVDALYKANQLTANGSNGFTGGSLMYFPLIGNAINIYGIHGNFTTPFVSGNVFPTAAIEFSVPASQSAGGTAYTNADLLYAYSKNVSRNGNPTTASLTFYHMLSKLELAIVIGDGAPVLAASNVVSLGSNDIVLNGAFTVSTTTNMTNQTDRAAMLATAGTPAKGTIGLDQQISTDFTIPNVVYNEAILVPQDMSGKVLTFKLANGGELKYPIPAGTTFESGKKHLYEITLTLIGLQITSTIVDWEPVNAVSGNAELD